MKNYEDKLIDIFFHVYDFNKVFFNELRTHQLTDGTRKRLKPPIKIQHCLFHNMPGFYLNLLLKPCHRILSKIL